PEPGAPPFVSQGAEVGERATLALVEVMKTFSPVRTQWSGVVTRILIEDGASIEAGQAMFWIQTPS
ncbi:MAG: acetyl-CoA carboxylase biotin carboxyl carrier protein, partial [Proteobacteria bacterium]|nr:acetyl-CoA carboxylase biotin carboxyl carrier protein [Pseudomonadota bacterium]